jgi:O-antigen/teichoic acid export membrane protein
VVSKNPNSRTKNYALQVRGSVIYRLIGVATTFVSLPMTIHYLGQLQFGVWTTLLSILTWMVFFDFGIGHGLKNEVAESLAKNDLQKLKKSISAGYTAIGFLSAAILLLFLAISFFVSWQSIFNTKEIDEFSLRLAAQISAVFILLNFWFGLINSILGALQKVSIITLNQTISNCLSLLFLGILVKLTTGKIWLLAISYGCALCAPNMIWAFILYYQHPEFRPKFSFEFEHWKSLLGIGSQFFIIQLAVMVLFLTDKILITQIFGPEYVTQYDVVFKVFSVLTLGHTLITAPLWSAYTDAHHRKDYPWIIKMFKRQIYIYGLVILATIMSDFFDTLYREKSGLDLIYSFPIFSFIDGYFYIHYFLE